jgi:hypothetical protein
MNSHYLSFGLLQINVISSINIEWNQRLANLKICLALCIYLKNGFYKVKHELASCMPVFSVSYRSSVKLSIVFLFHFSF